jgi:hypothetical protein
MKGARSDSNPYAQHAHGANGLMETKREAKEGDWSLIVIRCSIQSLSLSKAKKLSHFENSASHLSQRESWLPSEKITKCSSWRRWKVRLSKQEMDSTRNSDVTPPSNNMLEKSETPRPLQTATTNGKRPKKSDRPSDSQRHRPMSASKRERPIQCGSRFVLHPTRQRSSTVDTRLGNIQSLLIRYRRRVKYHILHIKSKT